MHERYLVMDNSTDIIDDFVGIVSGDPLDTARKARPDARTHAQGSFEALFRPEFPGTVTETERYAVAAFVAALHDQAQITEFYRQALDRSSAGNPAIMAAVMSEAAHGRTIGPYGAYPPGPLEVESVPGPEFFIDEGVETYVLGKRLAAALTHAHLLVLHPRDASKKRLQRLLDAGWSTTDIVTLSQVISFLSYQIRVATGLSVLKEASAP